MKQPSPHPISLADSDFPAEDATAPRLAQLEESVSDLAAAQKHLEERFARLLDLVERLRGNDEGEPVADSAIPPSAPLPLPALAPGLPSRAVRFVLRRVVGALRRLWQATDPAPPWDGEVRLVRGEKRVAPPRVARIRASEASAAENCDANNCDYVWIVPPAAPEPTTGEIETVKLLLASEELGFVIFTPPFANGPGRAPPSHWVVARELYDPATILDSEALERRLRHHPERVVGKRVGASSWLLPPPLLGQGAWRELLRPSGPWLLPRRPAPQLYEHRLSSPARPAPPGDGRPGGLFVLDTPLTEGLAATLARVLEAAAGRARPVLVDLLPQAGPAARRFRQLGALAPAHGLAGALEPELFPALLEHLALRHGATRLIHIGSRESAARWRSLDPPLELVDFALPPSIPVPELVARDDFFAFHLALSERVEKELQKRYPGAPVRRLEPFVQAVAAVGEERRQAVYRQTVRRELELPPTAIVVLWWGDLVPENRPEDLLALARRRRDDSRFVFLMAGEGPLFGQLDDARRLLELENLRLLSPRHGLDELMAACDVACSTAERDVFGVAIRAAFAAGRPVIAASADVATLLMPSGDGAPAPGIGLPRPGDLEAADAALEALATAETRRAMGEAGRARAAGAEGGSPEEWLQALGLASPEDGPEDGPGEPG